MCVSVCLTFGWVFVFLLLVLEWIFFTFFNSSPQTTYSLLMSLCLLWLVLRFMFVVSNFFFASNTSQHDFTSCFYLFCSLQLMSISRKTPVYAVESIIFELIIVRIHRYCLVLFELPNDVDCEVWFWFDHSRVEIRQNTTERLLLWSWTIKIKSQILNRDFIFASNTQSHTHTVCVTNEMGASATNCQMLNNGKWCT